VEKGLRVSDTAGRVVADFGVFVIIKLEVRIWTISEVERSTNEDLEYLRTETTSYFFPHPLVIINN
jgi:hypothetical protein